MLLDEPLDQLDVHHQMALLSHLRDRVGDGETAVLISLHDLNLAARFCDRLLLLFGDGEFVQGPPDALLDEIQVERLYRTPVECVTWKGGRLFVPR